MLKIKENGTKDNEVVLEIEDNYDINEELGGLADVRAMNELVANVKKQNEKFFIQISDTNVQEFDYKFDDPIFTLSEKVEAEGGAIKSANCTCCKDPFKSNKGIKYCHFCAQHFCGTCRSKEREFPKDDENFGDICKICERKFYIYDFLKDRTLQIEA